MAAPMSKIRKRAFRRARRRAEVHGATWYRGAWRSAQSLGTTSEQRPETNKQSAAQRLPVQRPPLAARPRLRTMTYNLGGLDPTSYVFCDWLQRQQDADIVFAQELHWGCGKTESSWNIGGWHAIICPDPASRYSGVGIFISARVAAPEQIAYNTITAPPCTLHEDRGHVGSHCWLPARLARTAQGNHCEAEACLLDETWSSVACAASPQSACDGV